MDPENKTDDTQPAPNAPPEDPQPKKRGPKPGSKNIPKEGAVPVPRKRPDEIADTKTAAQRRLEETRKILERHDKEHGTAIAAALPDWDSIATGQPAAPPPPQFTPDVIGQYLSIGFGLLGETLDVQSRPAPESIKTAAESLSTLSGFMPAMSPLAAASLTAASALAFCGFPMVMEYKEIKAGRLEPASKRVEK